MNGQATYEELLQHARERAILASVGAVLAWDEETVMPPGGAAHRAEQQAVLAGLAHERAVAPRLGELLGELEASGWLTEERELERANVRLLRREYERACRVPRALARELARTTTLCQEAWRQARDSGEYAVWRPWLEQVVRLERERAQALGGELYDALLEQYEPGCTRARVDELFGPLEAGLRRLLEALAPAERSEPPGALRHRVPAAVQHAFGLEVATALGFDPQRGRLDTAAHPSTEAIGPGDVRITTRFSEEDCAGALFCTLHELGHWLYDVHLPAERWGTPAGEALSLGLHESQSRLVENQVGRSRAFWRWCLPRMQRAFAPALEGTTLEQVLQAVRYVAPSPLRVQADEVTYNLHILIRYRLERALLEGQLMPAELPGAWSELYEKVLGLRPRTDGEGCLQDGHWSAGMFGYFPTYTLGNLAAAQLYKAALAAEPGLEQALERGDMGPLRRWLGEHLWRHGSTLPLEPRVERACGAPLSVEPLLAYLRERYLPPPTGA